MSKPSAEQVQAGQAVYSRWTLPFYDGVVLGLSNRLVWKCPTPHLLAWYNAHVRANHLEVGVGTGYFPDRCRFPTRHPRIVLLDLNPHCLAAASRRLRRFRPETVRANVLESIPFAGAPFDSIGLNYVLHCLPGPIPAKAVAFDHLLPLLNPGGVLFGSTLLAHGVDRGRLARRLMRFYNARGIFANADDRLDDLGRALADRFARSDVRVVGCAALFVAWK